MMTMMMMMKMMMMMITTSAGQSSPLELQYHLYYFQYSKDRRYKTEVLKNS